ncbi:MAG TPA: DUF4244 domain-containing protein [Dermatophilaceae bacterium]|jgi:hypothetical protein|nr:DUF4244 domain-containing protein [Actinomycetales bacterium]HMT32139.1 DUF4244 domain-containing protein [Dermatophilaceae bacterium]HMT90375.1 DUF4244 domain-containing protein [Dermatophilaceae bacterium]
MVRRGWKLTAEAVQARARGVRRRVDAGMTTAEYAVGTLAAVAMAVALIAVARSDMVRGALARVIQTALGAGG